MNRDEVYDLANYTFRKYLNLLKLNKVDNVLSWGYPIKSNLQLDSILMNKLNVSEKNGLEKFRYGYGYGLDEKSVFSSIINYENKKHSTSYVTTDLVICQSASYGVNRIFETIIWMMGVEGSITIIGPTFFRMLNKLHYTPGIKDINVVNGKSSRLFNLNREDLLEKIDNTKILFMCNPINPTYRFINNDDLSFVYNLCNEKGVFLVIDETGDAFGTKDIEYPFNLSSKYLIRLRSLSKTNLLAENRLALVFSKNTDFIKFLKENIGDDMSNVSFSSHDAIKYIFDSEADGNMESIYFINKSENINKIVQLRKLAISKLNSFENVVEVIEPETCFNILFKIKTDKFDTDLAFSEYMIKKYSTSVAPGSGFGIDSKEKYIRITFVVEADMLIKSLDYINLALCE